MTLATQQRSSWPLIALLLSIGLNLFLAALIGGHIWQAHRAATTFGEPLARALAGAEASLPPRDAAAFRSVIKREAPQYAGALHQFALARRQLAEEIIAPQYDAAKVQQALATWQSAWNRFFAEFGPPLVEALGQVSPEGRRKLIAERRLARGASSRP
jgi:uncharacterized membrane protein